MDQHLESAPGTRVLGATIALRSAEVLLGLKTGLRARLPGLEWELASYLGSLCLGFLLCKEEITVPT